MGIIANLQYFFHDTDREIHPRVETIFENHRDPDGGILSSLKNYTIEFLVITQKVYKKGVIHYPKTMLIALAVNSISSVLFLSISSLIVLEVEFYFLCKYEKLIFDAVRIYNHEHVSEWSSPTEEKQRVIALIEFERIKKRSCLTRLYDFFSNA